MPRATVWFLVLFNFLAFLSIYIHQYNGVRLSANFRFSLKQRNKDGDGDTVEITVYDYFVKHRNIDLRFSADLPCINVGKPKRPTYFPIEVEIWIRFNFYEILIHNNVLLIDSFLVLAMFSDFIATLHKSSVNFPTGIVG